MSDFIPADRLGNAVRYELPEVDGPEPQQKRRFSTARELEAIQEAAREEGYAAGVEQARREAGERLVTELRQLDAIFESLHAPLERLDDQMHQQMVELVMMVARQLLRRELNTDPALVLEFVRDALKRLPPNNDPLRVYLQPDDAQLLRDMRTLDELDRPWTIVDEIVLQRGDVRIETRSSSINSTIDARLGAMVAAALGPDAARDMQVNG